MITITNEDNLQLMSRYTNGYFDLAIVDLEYGIGASNPSKKNNSVKQKNGNRVAIKQADYGNKDWDNKISSDEYLKELFRVSKNQIIFGGNYYGLSGGYIVWDKLNGESDQFGCELAWKSFDKRTDIVYYMWNGMMQGTYCGKDIKKALIQQGNKSLNEKRIHETQKPVKLYKYLLNQYAKYGFKILDTHHGSGSLAIACYDMGFELIACEKHEGHYKNSIDRYNTYTQQQKLFTPHQMSII